MTSEQVDTVQPLTGATTRGPNREASERALIDAATVLFAERGPSAVSVREIAKRAGVNHGLVHHYFGSKAGLVSAVLDDLARESSIAAAERRGMGLGATLRDDFDRRVHLRVLAHVVLDEAAAPPGFQASFPLTQWLIDIARDVFGLEDEMARLRGIQAQAMIVGWMLFEPWLLSAGGFPAERAEELRMRLPQSVVLLAAKEPPQPVGP